MAQYLIYHSIIIMIILVISPAVVANWETLDA